MTLLSTMSSGSDKVRTIFKNKSVQQVANETGYFVLKYGQDTRAQAPDGTMKLGKKPRNIGLDLTDSPMARFLDVTIVVR